MHIKIKDIKIGDRHRKQLGDIQELANSIEEQGLLQPIGLTQDKELVFGARRIAAFEVLSRTEIEYRTVNVTSILDGEFAENTIRKDFTLDERIAIAKALEIEMGERRGNPCLEAYTPIVATCPPLKEKTRDIVAKIVGFGSGRTYEQAKEFIHTLNLTSAKEWDAYSKSGKRPNNIPSNPYLYYKLKGWISWYDFLGTTFFTYEEAKDFVKPLKLKGNKEWRLYVKTGNKPQRLPAVPDIFYRFKGWTNWKNFLGYNKKQKRMERKDYMAIKKYNLKEEKKQEYINVKYKLPFGKFKINKDYKLEWLDDPCINIYQDYYVVIDMNLNVYKVVKGNMVLNKVESNMILNNYKQVIDNGKALIIKEVAEAYKSFFRKKYIKGKIFILNSRRNVVIQMRILAMLYDKIIVFVKF